MTFSQQLHLLSRSLRALLTHKSPASDPHSHRKFQQQHREKLTVQPTFTHAELLLRLQTQVHALPAARLPGL